MKKLKIFCFGFGQVAQSFIRKIVKEKVVFELNISSRKKSQKKSLEKLDFRSYQFDDQLIDEDIFYKIINSDYILISIPPVNDTDNVIKYFHDVLKKTKAKIITYLSATSVYGNHHGDWVDESSETKPSTLSGIRRLNAERTWLKFSAENNLPLQIFRLSGIYSNTNNILKRLKSGESKIIKKENHFFSRIHIDDIANILFQSIDKFKKNEIYNISDDQPASQLEVATYASKLLNIKLPNFLKIDDLEEGMLKNFYKESKKVNNKKMKEFFNYKLNYPSYREGLDRIFNDTI